MTQFFDHCYWKGGVASDRNGMTAGIHFVEANLGTEFDSVVFPVSHMHLKFGEEV